MPLATTLLLLRNVTEYALTQRSIATAIRVTSRIVTIPLLLLAGIT
jgi:hypothetical protein